MENQNENLQPISAEDLAKQEALENAVTEEKVEDVVSDKADTQDEAPAQETTEEKSEPVGEDAGEATEVSDDVKENEEKIEEHEKADDVEEVQSFDDDKPAENEQEQHEETEAQEETEVNEIEELRKQVEEFQFEKEEREGVQKLQTTVQNVQRSIVDFETRVNAALRDALEDNKIDLNKTLDELKQENPAQYQVAIGYINQAEELKNRKVADMAKQVESVQNELIFKRAEREFNKFEMTDEEAQIAAETFINIMKEVGIQNLKDDLKTKVSLAVGQGKLLAKGVKEAAQKVADVAETVEEKAEEIQEALEVKKEVTEESEKVEEKPEEAHVEKEEKHEEEQHKEEALNEAMENPVNPAIDANAPSHVDDPDILSKLAQFKQGSREQLAFYKEHYGEISRAMARYHRGV